MNWHERMFQLAETVSSWSKDPSTKVGAVFVPQDKDLFITGWNGFPRGMHDDARLNDRSTKYALMCHAEVNAIYNAARAGVSLKGSSLYVYGLPTCEACSLAIIQCGVNTVHLLSSQLVRDDWNARWQQSSKNYAECGVNVIIH